jgi:hypothetical protein
MKKTLAGVLLCVACFAAPLAQAEARYLQADYMLLDMELSQAAADASPGAIQLKAGSQFYDFLGLEALLAFGVGDDEFSPQVGTNGKVELDNMIGVNALGRIPVSEVVEIFGHLGFARMDITVSGLGTQSGSYDDTDVLYGAGVGFKFTRYSTFTLGFSVLPEITLRDGRRIETTSINLGYRLSF